MTVERSRRRFVVAAALTAGLVALGGATAWALVGSDTPRVVADTAAHQPPATTATTTTLPPTTTVVVTTTAPPPTTIAPRPAPTTTVPPPTVPPTTQAPVTTVATAAAMSISPSTAGFPTLPPPYWPMPIVHVTVTNTGGHTLNGVVVHPVGVYSVPSNTCGTLAPGQSCGADVQFCPSSSGHYANTLIVNGQDAVTGSPIQATSALDGTAT